MTFVFSIAQTSLMRYGLALLFYCIPQFIPAQGKVSGKVTDAITHQPLPGATVYIDQTKIITQSDANGMFSLGNVQLNATLIISYSGYSKLTRQIEYFSNNNVYELFPTGSALENVVLKASTRDTWQKWGRLFSDILLGKGMDRECVLLNPEDVWFRYDKKNTQLKARARKPLLVENKMLGYKLHIDLDSLEYSLDRSILLYRMTTYFEFIHETDEQRQKMIAANRLRAYRGSRMHFIRALYNGTLEKEGFNLYQYKGKINVEKVRVESLLLKTIADRDESALQESANKIDLTGFGKDTALYFRRVLDQPGYYFQDSLPFHSGIRMRYGNDRNAVFKPGTDSMLLVYKEPEHNYLPASALRKWARMQEPGSALTNYDFIQAGAGTEKFTLMYLQRGEIINIRENGIIENSSNLFLEGFLADRRLAYDLPWDYDPLQDEQKLLNEEVSLLAGPGNTITNSLQHFGSSHTGSSLYLHPDKTIYDVGENIWFAAYLLQSGFSKEEHHTVYVLLQDPETRKTVTAEQFIMRDGHGAGYIFLPDTFPPGTYHLLAYTNTYPVEKNPMVFEQPLVVRPAIQEFNVVYDEKMQVFRNDSIFLFGMLKNETNQPVGGTSVSYRLTADGHLLLSGKAKTNTGGRFALKGLPVQNIAGKKLVIHTTINQQDAGREHRQDLKIKTNYLRLRWYPEGGDLVNGLPARLAYEVMDMYYQPSGVRVNLLEAGKLIGTLNTDGTGAGTIGMLPVAGLLYTTELLTDSVIVIENKFPPVLAAGFAITAAKGLVEDSLRFSVQSTKADATVFIMVHDYKKHYYFEKLAIPGNLKKFVMPAGMLPEGMSTITLFDVNGSPVAERSIFREPENQPVLTIEPDSAVYHTRSRINVSFHAADKFGNPVAAVFSLACVLNSRIDTTRFQDIVPFSLFNPYRVAGILDQKPDCNQYGRGRMENFLLIQGWTRYQWFSPDSTAAKNEWPRYTLLQRGYVFYDGEKLKKPVEIILVTADKLETILTDETGYFEIPKEKLISPPDWEINLAVNAKNQQRYTIRLVNDNDVLMNEVAMVDYPLPRKVNYSPEEMSPGVSGVKTLAAVTLKSTGGPDDDAARYLRGYKKDPDKCDDYVCMYNILNCMNHPGGRKPQKGRIYFLRTGTGMTKHYYRGCLNGQDNATISQTNTDTVVMRLKGRYYSKEFYVADYVKYNPPLPETLTTLYWNPLIKTDENGRATVSFYTNDLKGRHIIIAEGITAGSVLSGRRIFRVVQ